MKRPVIGITAALDEEIGSHVHIRNNYLRAVELAGGLPLVISCSLGTGLIPDILMKIDGLLFSGGGDIDPSFYGDVLLPETRRIDAERDRFETELFEKAYAKDLPILGICRGIQLINTAMGETLWQDVPTYYKGNTGTEHYQTLPGGRKRSI